MRKYRILQLTGSFHQGGTERQVLAIADGLIARGEFDIRLATLNAEGPLLVEAENIARGQIPEFRLNSFFDTSFIRSANAFATFLHTEGIDAVHSHDFYTNAFAAAAASIAGLAVHITSKRETSGLRTRGQTLVENFAMRRSNAIAANSVAVRDVLLDDQIPLEKIHVIHNGIDVTRFAQPTQNDIRGKLGLSKDVPLIVLVANLRHAVKNVPMLLRAAKVVINSTLPVHFAIAGEGELKGELQLQAEELGIAENITFLGRVGDIPGLLADAYAGVLTSDAEGFSNAILEYSAAGLPVVATRVGGAEEVLREGESGHLVEVNDSDGLARALISLLVDPAKAQRMGEKAKSNVEENFGPQRQIDKLSDLYRQTLAEAWL